MYQAPSFMASVIKRERKKIGLTQKKLAEVTGLGLKTIRKIEQDDESVSLKNVNHIFNFFGLELSPREIVTSPHRQSRKDLSQEEVLKILKSAFPILKLKFDIEKLGLFGSFARGEQSVDSDIDILFAGETGLSEEGEISLILEHLLFGYKVDLTRIDRIDQRLKKNILVDVIYL